MSQFDDFVKNTMPKIKKLSALAGESTLIDDTFYEKFDVKRGLRDINGTGVLAGLTAALSTPTTASAFPRAESCATAE